MDKREIISIIVDFDSFLNETYKNKSFFMKDVNLGRGAVSSLWDWWRLLQSKLFEFVDKLNDKTNKTAVDEKMNKVREDVKEIGNRNKPNFLLIPHLREVLSSLETLVKSCK